MRELKFRAWDGCVMFDDVTVIDNKHIMGDLLEDRMLIKEIMQYTGLKDKKGKEIYEGDITNYGVVEWCECLQWDGGGSKHPGFYFKDSYFFGRGELNYHTGFDKDIEVIGNIYENPGLLEVKWNDNAHQK